MRAKKQKHNKMKTRTKHTHTHTQEKKNKAQQNKQNKIQGFSSGFHSHLLHSLIPQFYRIFVSIEIRISISGA